ncbi:MAG: S26 family signal peptidase [Chitinivibrionales bacterium]|nr:S26 family signal peptidase [Chitinivibrionales bacterium]
MPMRPDFRQGDTAAPVDLRIVIYRFVKGLALVAAAALVLKIFFFETVLVKTDQMRPVLIPGDRVLVWRSVFAPFLAGRLRPARTAPVIFALPHQERSLGCLRIAALSGDTIAIVNGMPKVSGTEEWGFGRLSADEEELPAEFSPRDNMEPFIVPAPGQTLRLDSASLRDFFFFASLIAQENPARKYAVRPALFIDGKEMPNYFIADFSLFRGSLDSIPARFRYDWYFWDKLRRYVSATRPNSSVELQCALYDGQNRIFSYPLRAPAVFLLADNWSGGYDSRYIGPVLLGRCKGQVMAVLWSRADAGLGLRADRLVKIIR